MNNKEKINYGDDSPIAAFATTPGNSALTIIRCSGKGCLDMFLQVFSAAEKIKNAPGNTIVYGWIISPEKKEKIDETLVSVFRAPKSYTGEDGFDISCHGGLAAGKAVMDTLKAAGFRDALPGEFTFRAFLNGKIDLTRSESVMELVSAKTNDGRRYIVSRLCGSLEKEITEIKTLIVQVLAGAEIYLDYSEDEVSAGTSDVSDEAAGRLPCKDLAITALERLKKLYPSWQAQRLYQEGVTVVIAGSPNSGKSLLFNTFLKEDRSIVTERPGTTRDWIEAWVSIKGIPVRLIDTAGLRDTNDEIEKIGIQRSKQLLQDAQIILYIVDCTKGVTDEDRKFIMEYSALAKDSGQIFLLIWNKIDIAAVPLSLSSYMDVLYKVNNAVSISAKSGEGLDELNNEIALAITSSQNAAQLLDTQITTALGTERQKKLVGAAIFSLEEALLMADNEEPLDLITPLLREAVNALGEITGEVSTADILHEMFSRFCVGK